MKAMWQEQVHKGERKHSEPEFGRHGLTATIAQQHEVMDNHCDVEDYNVQLCHASRCFAWTRLQGTEGLDVNQKVAGFVLQLFPSCLRTALFR
jgi:hypothetical protein